MSTTHAPRSPLPRTVIALGWVSLLTDAASDMIYPLVPAFLLSLGGGAEALGWLEGIAELIAALLKLGSGRISDRWKRRKPLIALGYGISALARPFYALAMIPLHAVLIRAGDRVGKGLRGPARDAMVADAVPAADRGNAQLQGRYDPLSPAFQRLIGSVINAGGRHGKSISVCGEIAGDPIDAMALLALGLRTFSMAPPAIGPLRAINVSPPLAKACSTCARVAIATSLLPARTASTTSSSPRERARRASRCSGQARVAPIPHDPDRARAPLPFPVQQQKRQAEEVIAVVVA